MRRRLALPVHRLALVASFASTSCLNYIFGLAAGWLLAPGEFGLLAFAQSLLLIGGLVLETGIPWALARAVARSPLDRHAPLIRGALVANLAIAAVLAASVLVLFASGPLRPGLEGVPIVLLVCLALPYMAVSTVARGATQGVERFWAMAAIQVIEVVGKVGVGIGLVAAGLGATGALAGFLIGSLGAGCLGAWLVRNELRPGRTGWGLELPRLDAVAPSFGALLAFALLLNLDLLAVKLFAPEERALAGYYQAGTMLANLPCYLVTSAVVPTLFARLARAGRLAATGPVVASGLRLILLLVLPFELVLALMPTAVLGLAFPASYAAAAVLLAPVALARGALLPVALLSAAFQAAGHASVPARALVGLVLLEALGLPTAVVVWRVEGAALTALITALAAMAVLGGAYLWHVRMPSLRGGLAFVLRYAAALGLSVGIGAAITLGAGMSQILAALAGALCYAVAVPTVGLLRARPAAAEPHGLT